MTAPYPRKPATRPCRKPNRRPIGKWERRSVWCVPVDASVLLYRTCPAYTQGDYTIGQLHHSEWILARAGRVLGRFRQMRKAAAFGDWLIAGEAQND